MNPEIQRRIQRYGWDKAAPYYEAGWQDQLWAAQESMIAAADPQPGENILDVSCGTGLVTFPLANLVSDTGHVTGIDISQGMIDMARSTGEQRAINNTTFIRSQAENLPFKDNSFDAVICSLGLMYFASPHIALNEMHRVVKKGGSVISLVSGERHNCGWSGIFPIMQQRVKTGLCPQFFELGTGTTLENLYSEVGFGQIESYRFLIELTYRDGGLACQATVLGAALAFLYLKLDENTQREVDEEYLASILKFKKGNGYAIPMEFVVTRGTK